MLDQEKLARLATTIIGKLQEEVKTHAENQVLTNGAIKGIELYYQEIINSVKDNKPAGKKETKASKK